MAHNAPTSFAGQPHAAGGSPPHAIIVLSLPIPPPSLGRVTREKRNDTSLGTAIALPVNLTHSSCSLPYKKHRLPPTVHQDCILDGLVQPNYTGVEYRSNERNVSWQSR